jgi:hypothetical protein
VHLPGLCHGVHADWRAKLLTAHLDPANTRVWLTTVFSEPELRFRSFTLSVASTLTGVRDVGVALIVLRIRALPALEGT